MVDDAIPPDDVLDVLDAAVQLLDDEAGAFPAVAERARLLRERRAAGWTYTEIMTSGGGLSVIEGRAAAAAAHSATASRLRRAAALALRNEGLSTDRIAQLLQVSRQRISALLRSSGRWQAPTDDRPGRRHARELALTDQEYGLIAESIPHLVFVAAPDGSVCSINTRWSQYTGIKRETTHGWNWSMFLHPDDVEDALSNWRHAILTETAYSVECRVRAANGQFTWHTVRALPITAMAAGSSAGSAPRRPSTIADISPGIPALRTRTSPKPSARPSRARAPSRSPLPSPTSSSGSRG